MEDFTAEELECIYWMNEHDYQDDRDYYYEYTYDTNDEF